VASSAVSDPQPNTGPILLTSQG